MKMTFRLWVFAFTFIVMLIAISPNFETGVIIKTLNENSSASIAGMQKGEIIKEIDGKAIKNMQDYTKIVSAIEIPLQTFYVVTKEGNFSYNSTTLGFEVDNLTIISSEGEAKESGIAENMTLVKINDIELKNDFDFYTSKNLIETKVKLSIKTNKKSYQLILNSPLDIGVGEVPRTKVKTGLDLQGGARGLVKPERKLTQKELADLISISSYRLNVYGISDVSVRAANDLSGNTYMLVEVAGATPKDLKELIGQQGKFEARIGNETAFIGGKKDITSVCRNDATCAGIDSCLEIQDGYACRFRFVVYLSEESAKKHAEITKILSVNTTEQGTYLNKKLNLYLDDKLADSLLISEDLRGKITTQVQVQGSGVGKTREEAYEAASKSMNKLQTVLITGSLPFKLEIVKLDSISPLLGGEFLRAIFVAAALAFGGVFAVLYFRFKNLKICFLIFGTMTSEVIMTLGLAALIKWNLDLASIAGIIAAIGTGVDDQIVIVDESRMEGKESGIKERLKRAMIIIFGAYSTVVASLLPLFWAGAGLLRGFAITTFIGISLGVFITRPAFADIIKQMQEK
ncbi:MAG: hypothetical protein V1660_04740 [archaeon]